MSADPEAHLRKELLDYGVRAYESGFVTETEGNISARLDKSRVLVSPSHIPYEQRTADDFVLLDLDGNVLKGERRPTSEHRLHLAIFRAREDVGAVLHAHPLYSSVLAVAREPLRPILDEMIPYLGGVVEVADFAPSGSQELADAVLKGLGSKSAVIMANHGTVCVGKNLSRAYQTTKYVEKWSHITILAMMLGKLRTIPDERQAQELPWYDFLKAADW
jgi:L-fuculose-phosphate aldolase